uniref:Uncharacterized protein n=1 Tax=Aegilops tauschii subsp. strangulata TaxID=200361 RepID=A0A453I3R4_AEGTS
IPCTPPDDEPSLLDWWQSARHSTPKPMRKGLGTVTLLVPWMIWKHRNDCIFNGARPSMNTIVAKIKEEAALWANAGALGLKAITPQTWDVH